MDKCKFTFHYVSIKSSLSCGLSFGSSNLHSTMYLLNLSTNPDSAISFAHLHSTMYLLNHDGLVYDKTWNEHLHSTMYLLNQAVEKENVLLDKFTFHYVSIKSRRMTCHSSVPTNLHSTMYLLNPNRDLISSSTTLFTFHYVSIKSLT